ncbi:competence type IV pilus ATPase ComGA [Solibacillus sp. FSL H8-0538]|uniref:competence type IV pilus ATPase ComGA n=1 Tax=Solibacillus sp. FSL H8-0538 TaxID=2921400 RepID=UPI0030F6AF4D
MEMESVIETKSEQLLLKACHFGASDLHLVPAEHNYAIMFRKYGRFIQAGELPNDIAGRVISYFKFLSSLDISEKRKPQSGSFQKEVQDNLFAFRVSTLPSAFAKESLAIRLLRQNYALPLTSLCYKSSAALQLYSLVEQPQGLLLFSGATGSGKTTSLYSLVQYCSRNLGRHVISLEDPVESSQEQLLQIQVNERAGVSYASGLKAILRHSPDVIMIGEIRDKETAKIAMEAALTGHLVLSTIHAKDTVNCLYRLLDLGLSIEELRQTLVGIVAQTLITTPTEERKALIEVLAEANLGEAMMALMHGESYDLPFATTLTGQLKRFEVDSYVPSTS